MTLMCDLTCTRVAKNELIFIYCLNVLSHTRMMCECRVQSTIRMSEVSTLFVTPTRTSPVEQRVERTG